MQRIALVLAVVLVLAIPADVKAQTVQKCIGRDGHVTLTSDACPGGSRELERRAAPPEVLTPARAAEIERQRREAQRWSEQQDRAIRSRPREATRTSASASESRNARCDAAKRHRASQREIRGIAITYLETRRLDEQVYDACK